MSERFEIRWRILWTVLWSLFLVLNVQDGRATWSALDAAFLAFNLAWLSRWAEKRNV